MTNREMMRIRDLAACVLIQALKDQDALYVTTNRSGTANNTQHIADLRRDAAEFVRGENGAAADLEFWCTMAGVEDMQAFSRRFRSETWENIQALFPPENAGEFARRGDL